MKTIRIQISESERQELFLLRQKSGDYRSERALAVLYCADGKRGGFTAKRAKKTTPAHAPSKEEKLQRVQEITSAIAGLRCNGDVDVMFLDESHFPPILMWFESGAGGDNDL